MANGYRIRTEKYLLTLLPEERALLEKNSFELGLSKADYLRKIILYGSIVGQHPVIDKATGEKLLYEVNRIGNNINQIAYNTNARMHASDLDWREIKNEAFLILELLGSLIDMDRDEFVEWENSVLQCIRKHQQMLKQELLDVAPI